MEWVPVLGFAIFLVGMLIIAGEAIWNAYREARVHQRFGDRDVIIKRARLEERLERAA